MADKLAGDDLYVKRVNRIGYSDTTYDYRFGIYVNETNYNPTTNVSTATFTLGFDNNTSYVGNFGNQYWSGHPYAELVVNGTVRGSGYVRSSESSFNPNGGQNFQLCSGSGTFTHDSNGALSVTCGVIVHKATAGGYCTDYGPTNANAPSNGTVTSAGGFFTTPFVIKYDANGGTSTPANQFSTGGAITLASAISKSSTTSTSTLTHTFNGNNGNTPSPSTKTTTKTATTSYPFNKGAAGSPSGTQYSASGSYTPTGNVTMYATGGSSTSYSYSTLGTLPTCTRNNTTATTSRAVTFDANGGSVTPTSATSSATITTTYSLKGGYTASSGGSAISTSTTPTANTTYWAQGNSSSSTGAYAAVSLPTPTRTNYRCTGGYTATSGGTLRGAAGGSYTPSASETIHAQGIEVHKLDVNGGLDGASVGNTTNYGTFDVYVGGVKKATGVTDFYQDVDKGASYEIKNITALSGKKYIGVHSGSLTGTMGTANIGVALEFRTLNVWVNVNGTGKHGVIGVNNNGTGKTANVHVNASSTGKQGK